MIKQMFKLTKLFKFIFGGGSGRYTGNCGLPKALGLLSLS
jgi:hypothetical protein